MTKSRDIEALRSLAFFLTGYIGIEHPEMIKAGLMKFVDCNEESLTEDQKRALTEAAEAVL